MERNIELSNHLVHDSFDVKKYRNIYTLGIFPYSKSIEFAKFSAQLVSSVNAAGYKCYEDIATSNDDTFFTVFNICLDDMIYLSGKHDLSSFWFGRVGDGVLVLEYWEKAEPSKRFNSKTNTYVLVESTSRVSQTENQVSFIGDHYGFSLDTDKFKCVDDRIETNILAYREKYPTDPRNNKSMIEHSMNPLGRYSSYRMRCYLNK